jgi:hypothetical protein
MFNPFHAVGLDAYRSICVVNGEPHPTAPIDILDPIDVSECCRECEFNIGVRILRIVDVRRNANYTNLITNLEREGFH